MKNWLKFLAMTLSLLAVAMCFGPKVRAQSTASTIYINCVNYSCSPDIGVALNAAETAICASSAVGGKIVLPSGFYTETVNIPITCQTIVEGQGGPGFSGVTGLNFTGTGTMFSVSANLGFRLTGVQVTGAANPAVSIATGTANGQNYEIDHDWFVVTGAINIGTSSPFLNVHDNHFRDTQYDISVGQETDGYITHNFFDADLITTAQAHLLLTNSGDFLVIDNTFLGTNTTTPDIIYSCTGGVINSRVRIDGNKFGNEEIGNAPERILFNYTSSGTCTFGYGSISRNYVSNVNGGNSISDFIKVSNANVELLQDHFDSNVLSSGPNTGYFLDNPSSPPFGASANTANYNAIIPNTFTGVLHNTTEFASWTAPTSAENIWTELLSGASRASQQIADQGSACTNGELALSAGWGTSPTVTAVAGTGQSCTWTITSGTGTPTANPTITDTLTNPLPSSATVCPLHTLITTGTPAIYPVDQTTLSATAPVF